MIQKYLKDEAAAVVPELEWTVDFYTGQDNTGTVYSEGGQPPDTYESGLRYPEYMVFIRSSDWAFAKKAAEKVFKQLHRKSPGIIEVDGSQVEVHFIEALSDPLRLGAQDPVMEYSINLKVTLREV